MRNPLFSLLLLAGMASAGLAQPAADPSAGVDPSGQATQGTDRAEQELENHYAADLHDFSLDSYNLLGCVAHVCYTAARTEQTQNQLSDATQTKVYTDPNGCVAHFHSLAQKFKDFDDLAGQSKANPSLIKDDGFRKSVLAKVTAFNARVQDLVTQYKRIKQARQLSKKSKGQATNQGFQGCEADPGLPDLTVGIQCTLCSADTDTTSQP